MQKPEQSRADRYFAKNQNKDSQFYAEREKARQETLKLTAKLRALRLAAEAADEKAAEKTTSGKATAKNKKQPAG